MRRFVTLFLVVLVALFALELTQPAQRLAVTPWTEGLARAAAWVLMRFDTDVRVAGRVLQSASTGFAVSIEAGCNGVEAALVLIAAIAAFRAPWRYKVGGIVAGLLAVQLLNLLRVITLYYLGQWSLRAFEWAHLYAWQALIMLDVVVIWLLWLRTLPRAVDAPADGAASR